MVHDGTPIGTQLPPLPLEKQIAFRAASKFVERAFVMFKDKSAPQFAGSGVLVEHAGVLFACTAGHVVEYILAHSASIVVVFFGQASTMGLERLVGYEGMLSCGAWSEHDRYNVDEADRVDLGFIVMPDERMRAIPGWESVPFEMLGDIDANKHMDRALVICGGPAVGQVQVGPGVVECDTEFVLGTFRGADGKPRIDCIRPELLQIEWTKIAPPGGGALTHATKPAGMSGGPVFLCSDPGSAVWSPRAHLILFGILIFHLPDQGVVLAEPIQRLRERIVEAVAELDPARRSDEPEK